MSEQISRQLREAAEAHRPDRARMLARVERGMASATRRPAPRVARSWSKVTFAGAAAAGILATAGLAVAVVGSAPPPPDTLPPPAVSNSSPAPSVTSTVVPPPAAANQPNQSTPDVPESPSTTSSRLSDGPLSAKGSVDSHSHTFWTQDTLVVGVTEQLTALSVEVHIAQTGGVENSGHWQTSPVDDYTFTVREADGELIYRWELKPGRTVPVAQHTFAVQYNHTRGVRDGKADRYGVMSGSRAVWGGFDRA